MAGAEGEEEQLVQRRIIMRWKHFAAALGLALLFMPANGPSAEPSAVALDVQMLREANIATDGPGLLAFLRKRTLANSDLDHIRALIRDLGNDSFETREKASAQLVASGAVAIPLLRLATRDPDIEIVRRAEDCLRRIGQAPES